jgi:hypothetical protein
MTGDLLDFALNRAAILHASSAWGTCEDGMLIEQLVERIRKAERRAAMETLLAIDGELYGEPK